MERASDYSHISMHSVLLTTPQVHGMVDKLRAVYVKDDDPTAVSEASVFYRRKWPQLFDTRCR